MRPALPACACSGSVTRVQAAFHHTATTLVVMCFVLPCLLRLAQGAATQVHTAVHAMFSTSALTHPARTRSLSCHLQSTEPSAALRVRWWL